MKAELVYTEYTIAVQNGGGLFAFFYWILGVSCVVFS